MSISVTQTLVMTTCTECGILMAIPLEFDARLRSTHRNFYCLNGHPQHYAGKTEIENLREKCKRLEDDRDWWSDQFESEREAHATTEARRRAEKAAKTKMKNRIAKGVCPCCNRHFENLQRHIESEHPDYVKADDE
jgi:hypothetical protein